MKKVITYGTFDLFHFGNLEILRRVRELGDFLVVGVLTDEFNKINGKKCGWFMSGETTKRGWKK